MDRPRLSPRHHHPDRRRRTARRHHRPPAAAAGRHRPVHGGLGPVRRRADALAADRRPGGAGPGRGHHDGARHGLCRRDGAEGKDRQRHGAARHDVGDRHRARPIARRRPDRRARLAGDLPRQRAAGHPGASSSRYRHLPADRRGRRPDRAGFDIAGHAAACPDARGLCARHDDRARQLRPAQPGPAAGRRRRGRPLRARRGESRVAADPAGDVPRSGAERGPRHERARLDGDDGDAGGRAVLSLARARARRGPRRARHVGRPARRRADRRAGRPHRRTASARGA